MPSHFGTRRFAALFFSAILCGGVTVGCARVDVTETHYAARDQPGDSPDRTADAGTDSGSSDTGSAPSSVTDRSFRVMTWNLGFIADGKNIGGSTWDGDEDRANWIADRILAEQADLDIDIFAMNEVFDEPVRSIFVQKLLSTWPHAVTDLASGEVHEQDSGLMLWSRFGFTTPANDLGIAAHFIDPEHGRALTNNCPSAASACFWPSVAFVEYQACSGSDCLAAKGVGLAQVQHPGTGQRINVGFSHMQSTNSSDIEDYAADRDGQFADARDLFNLLPNLDDQVSIFMGDLNVRGQGCNPSGCPFTEFPNAFVFEDTEWERRMLRQGPGNYWSCNFLGSCPSGARFRDGWGHTMPEEDRGITGSIGHAGAVANVGTRLDYILHTIPSERLVCLQHMRVLRHIAIDGTLPSDHLPVWAEFNHRAPHCDIPNALTFAPNGNGDMYVPGQITYPRSVQWIRVEDEGTFTIQNPPGSPVGVEVYAADDISYPIHPVEENQRIGPTYHLPEPPYFIKVSAHDPTYTGSYAITVREHQCGPNDCCYLNPGGAATTGSWSGQLTDSGDRWFCFDTDVTTGGAFPTLLFEEENNCSNPIDVELYERVGNAPGTLIPWSSIPNLLPSIDGATGLAPGRYMVRSAQNYVTLPLPACETRVSFRTNLTYVRLDSLGCNDETGASGTLEEAGHDEIWMSFRLDDDGGYCTRSYDMSDYTFLQSFDEDDHRAEGLRFTGDQRFLNCASLDFLEADASPPRPGRCRPPQRTVGDRESTRHGD